MVVRLNRHDEIQRTLLAALLLAGSALAPVVGLSPALAQAALPAQGGAGEPVRRFAIPAGPLDRALTAFGAQAGRQVSVETSVVRGISSPGVTGQMTAAQALSHLLGGTGLTARQTGNVVTLGRDSATIALAPVRVGGTAPLRGGRALAETATGPVRGYVAHVSNTGTKTDTPLIETAQSVSVLSRDFIVDTGAQSVSQVLAYTSGVQSQPYGFDSRYDQFMLRGFGANTYGNYRDGMRFANGSFAQFRSEPYEAERIEVFRGPTSVLYGSNNPGGLVNFVSKLPTATPTREVTMVLGNWNRFQGEFDLGGALDAQGLYRGRITGLVRDSDTQVPQTKDNRIAIAPSLTIRLGARTSLTLFGEYQKNLYPMWPYYYRSAQGLTHVRLGDPAFNALRQQQYYFGYKLEHRVNDVVTLRQNLRYGRVFFDGEFTDAGAVLGPTEIGLYSGRWRERLEGTNIDNQAQFRFHTGPVKHTFLFGVDYFRQRLDSEYGEGNNTFTTLMPRSLTHPVYGRVAIGNLTTQSHTYQTIDQVGLYGQEQLVWNRWHVLLGGREDIVATSSRNQMTGVTTTNNPRAFTGRASLLYLFDCGVAPYFSYSTSFLPTSGTTSAARGTRAFAPTRGDQYELGVKYQPHDFNGSITADVYDLHEKNVLTTDPDNVRYSIQTGEVRSRGAEIEGVMSLGNGLSAMAQYTHTEAKNMRSNTAQGKIPVAVPKNAASLFLMYTVPGGMFRDLGIGGGVRFTDKNWADIANTQHNDALTLFDINLRKAFGPVTAQLNVNNIANRRVAICNTGNCTWSMGRMALGSIRVRW